MAALLIAAALRSVVIGPRAPLISPWIGGARQSAAPACARAFCVALSAPDTPGAPEVGGVAGDAGAGAGADDADTPWTSLGMAPELLDAVTVELAHARPTPIQVRAFAAIRAPDCPDVVIAGETGIGKTLAYLLPAFDILLEEAALAEKEELLGVSAADAAESAAELDGRGAGVASGLGGGGGGSGGGGFGSVAGDVGAILVLQPNADLAYQAAAVAEKLLRGSGLSLINLHEPHDYGALSRAHVLLGTPPRVLDALYEHAERLGPRVRLAVLDEADSLLAGSFKTGARQKYPVEQLLLALRQERKARAADAVALAADAADAAGRAGGERPPPPPAPVRPLQHVLVGATVPAHGTRNVKARVLQLFPRAVWVQSAGLHSVVSQLSVSFVRVDGATGGGDGGGGGGGGRAVARDDAFAAAVRSAHGAGGAARADSPGAEGGDSGAGGGGGDGVAARTLVFANTLPAVERALGVLEALGVPAAPFHKKIAVPDRRDALARFASGELRALVSTGLAARGLDISNVEHVIEYEFAQNVVEHLHRIGRTARASRPGRATCLVGPDDSDLARAIEAGLDAGTGIESAVSRNRSFRNRLKRERAGPRAGRQS